jgi:hypothetical protein
MLDNRELTPLRSKPTIIRSKQRLLREFREVERGGYTVQPVAPPNSAINDIAARRKL